MRNKLIAAVFALPVLFSAAQQTAAQGNLTPSGPPAPTMKTLTQIDSHLSQVESRTPIPAAPFSITVPGSYYLTTNLTVTIGDAIYISTNNVTLDLNGFTIFSTRSNATTDSGIALGNVADITIRNGHIKGGVTNNAGVYNGSGFGYGIYCGGSFSNIRVVDVTVSGCLYDGIYIGINNSTLVESCTVRVIGNRGIFAQTISHSSAYQCGGNGITAGIATDCYGLSTRSTGDGVYGNVLNNCYGYNMTNGIGLHAGSVAMCCYGYSFSGIGLSSYIANSCVGISGPSGTNVTASFKYNMP